MMAALLVTLETPTGKALNINDMVGIFFHSFALHCQRIALQYMSHFVML